MKSLRSSKIPQRHNELLLIFISLFLQLFSLFSIYALPSLPFFWVSSLLVFFRSSYLFLHSLSLLSFTFPLTLFPFNIFIFLIFFPHFTLYSSYPLALLHWYTLPRPVTQGSHSGHLASRRVASPPSSHLISSTHRHRSLLQESKSLKAGNSPTEASDRLDPTPPVVFSVIFYYSLFRHFAPCSSHLRGSERKFRIETLRNKINYF